ncbi:hypothetical protein BRADI_4g15235v3 [Brachypodium distachyon]|uniref:Ubiquitin-like protease family profile domain-containing protein n=1 Tax=Brachypodium distachyon TaxID=15368 RepID=A0A2K2CMZ2_BRADI|nr:hypothetical protein BRADI_4g15235v3 [Brachypodium distachyon]
MVLPPEIPREQVDVRKILAREEPWVFAKQCKQIFYIDDPANKGRVVPCRISAPPPPSFSSVPSTSSSSAPSTSSAAPSRDAPEPAVPEPAPSSPSSGRPPRARTVVPEPSSDPEPDAAPAEPVPASSSATTRPRAAVPEPAPSSSVTTRPRAIFLRPSQQPADSVYCGYYCCHILMENASMFKPEWKGSIAAVEEYWRPQMTIAHRPKWVAYNIQREFAHVINNEVIKPSRDFYERVQQVVTRIHPQQ